MENTGPMHSLPVRRAPNGHPLPGSVLNAGGRPKSAIEEGHGCHGACRCR
jgi:hypothetical protein